MSLKQQIQEDLKKALKERNELNRSVLRSILSEINAKEIELNKKEEGISEQESAFIVTREIKKRDEAASQYRQGSRDDLAEAEEAEKEVLKKYAAPQLSESEVTSLIDDIIKELGASDSSDMGRVIGEVMKRAGGKADGNMVSAQVKARLNN